MTHPTTLPHDPFNLIVTGVGGQGTVTASRLIGEMLSLRGLCVTIGETFGASQRGGAVMSHLRLSTRSGWSPQIPRGQAHLVVAFEPIEGLRVLRDYGNPAVIVVSNTRAIPPESVMGGECRYPDPAEWQGWVRELASRVVFLDATDEALRLGNPILTNSILVGAIGGLGLLPLRRGDFERLLAARLDASKVKGNLAAYDWGQAAVAAA